MEIVNQKIAISILKRLGYIDVAIANNGKEVLNLMKTSVFDVIFVSYRSLLLYKMLTNQQMDLYMPEMDGLEVTREIIKERTGQQEQPNNNEYKLLNCIDVYIIALTASASREDRQICIDAGMNDFISKPFTMVEMKSALKTCANNRKKRRKLRQQKDDPMVDIE
jgi:CheY-like chemotaxis protein